MELLKIICIVVTLGFIGLYLFFRPGGSIDPRIVELQKEAYELRIYEKTKTIRENAVELFGFRYFGQPFIQNDVSFSGRNGAYEIEYKDIFVKWKDWVYLKIYYQDSQVYEVDLNLGFWNKFSFKLIRSYIQGSWTDEFNEMYEQVMKGIPAEEEELKKKWGIE